MKYEARSGSEENSSGNISTKTRRKPGSLEQAFGIGGAKKGSALEDAIAGGTTKRESVTIARPDMAIMPLKLIGTAPLVMNRFGQKALQMMHDAQSAGSQARSKKKREAKDFQECYEQAKHVSHEGWCGIPAPAFRNAAISACRLVGFKMTLAKLSVFIVADGYDAVDAMPLVKITKGEPKYFEVPVRNATGVIDLRARPMWDPGWEATVRVRFDRGQFSPTDITNLFWRIGEQVGVCEGRPDSKMSAGMEWGLFRVVEGDND